MAPAAPGALARTYRIFRWIALAWLALVLILVLRQPAPPEVDSDPQAPARLEEKLAQSDEATSLGQAHDLLLDEAELNVLMRSSLGLDGGTSAGRLPAGPGSDRTASRPAKREAGLSVEEVKNLSLLLEGRLFSSSGTVRFEPPGAMLGSLRIPRAVLDRTVTRHFESPENLEKLRLPPQVDDVRIHNGALVVSYR